MIDLILLTFYALIFCGGFYCGAKFGSFKAMIEKARAGIKAAL